MPEYRQEISNISQNVANKKEIENLLKLLVTFKEDEFVNLLHKCHKIIRNIEKLDPVTVFDEIAKILFMKVYVERLLLKYLVLILKFDKSNDFLRANTKGSARQNLSF